MKSARFDLFFEIVLAIAAFWMTVDSVGRREWLSAVIFFLLALNCVHSAWKDIASMRSPRSTA